GQGVQLAAGVEQRAGTGGVHELVDEAEFGDEVEHLGAACDERLRADVHRVAGERDGAEFPTEPLRPFEHDDPGGGAEGAAEPVRGDEAADTAADDCNGRRGHSERTSSTTRVTTSGAASGRTP